MKKTLLLSTALLTCAIGCAQNNKYATSFNKPISVRELTKPSPETDFPSSSKRLNGPVSHLKSNGVCTPVKFASATNAFTVGGGVTTFQQNLLSYNKDLNNVLWTSRVSQYWTFVGKTTGAIQSTWMDVSTNVWDSMIIFRDSSNERPARYPSGVLFNPSGNTTMAGAQMVGSGPVTITLQTLQTI